MSAINSPTPTTATVVVNYGQHATVLIEHALHRASKLRRAGNIVAGDKVSAERRNGAWVITECLARSSVLERPDRRHQPKPIAANISLMVIVSAPEPGLSQRLIDQYLVAADHIGCQALLAFTKKDRWQPDDQQAIDTLQRAYADMQVPSLGLSHHQPDSIDALRQRLHGETAIFVGQSGAGKSSLTNALLPQLAIRVGELSAASGQGAHTTTTTTLYPLSDYEHDDSGFILDSPGVREFNLSHLTTEAIRQGFFEIHALSKDCRFNNCLHRQEPQCAVRSALDLGQVNPKRYQHYLEMLEAAEQHTLWR